MNFIWQGGCTARISKKCRPNPSKGQFQRVFGVPCILYIVYTQPSRSNHIVLLYSLPFPYPMFLKSKL